VAFGKVFLPVITCSPFSNIPLYIPCTHFMLLLPAGHTDEAGEPSKKQSFLEIGENWIEKYFHQEFN
jgi:hypothetical protein